MGRWIKQDVSVRWTPSSDEVTLAGQRWSDDERWALVPHTPSQHSQRKFALVLIPTQVVAVYVDSRKEAEELLAEFAWCSTSEIEKDRFSTAAKEELQELKEAITRIFGFFRIG